MQRPDLTARSAASPWRGCKFALGWRELWGRRTTLASALFALVLLAVTLWNIFGWRTLV